jgi:hypothetical protein
MSFVFFLSLILATFCTVSEYYGNIIGVASGVLVTLPAYFLLLWFRKLRMKLMIKKARKKMEKFSTDDLKQHLYSQPFSCPDGLTPNYLIMELISRGEDATEYIDLVLDMLEDDSLLRRIFGYGAFRSAYPYLVNIIIGYNPQKPVEHCREKVAEIRKKCQAALNE